MNSLGKFIIGGLLLWYGVLRGANGLIVKIQNYRFRGVDVAAGTVSLDLNFMIKNPLLVGVTIKGVTGDVYIQGQKVGYINTSMDYYLSGGRTHIIPVVVNLQIAQLGQAALQNIQSGNIQTLTVAFDGKLYAGKYNVGVPVQIDLNYNDLVK